MTQHVNGDPVRVIGAPGYGDFNARAHLVAPAVDDRGPLVVVIAEDDDEGLVIPQRYVYAGWPTERSGWPTAWEPSGRSES